MMRNIIVVTLEFIKMAKSKTLYFVVGLDYHVEDENAQIKHGEILSIGCKVRYR